MEFFVKNIRIKKSFFSRKHYLCFSFLSYSGWKRRRVRYVFDLNTAPEVAVGSLITSLVREELFKDGVVPEVKAYVNVVSYYHTPVEGERKFKL